MSKKKNETEIKLYSDQEAERLADAIILQAVKDYRDNKLLKKYAEGSIKSLGRFFNSEYAELLGRGADLREIHSQLKAEPVKDEELREVYERLDGVFERDLHHLTIAKRGKLIMIVGANVSSVETHKQAIIDMIEAVNKKIGLCENTAQNGTNTGV